MEQVELVDHFLNTFQLLTPKQQRIWRYLQSYAKYYRNVFPSHAKIAEACKCHRDTVITAINRFKSHGWLSAMKRAYTSCLYFLVDALVGIDTLNPDTFKKKNFSDESDINSATNTTVINTNKFESIKNDIERIETVQELEKEGIQISQEDLYILTKLSKRNPGAMKKAIEDCKSLSIKEVVRNPAALITNRFKYHDNKASISCPNEIKHLNLKESDQHALAKLRSQNMKAFLYAYEDYKSYSIFRKVGNVAAFIVSRFKSYLNEEPEKKEDQVSNLTKIKFLLKNCSLPKNINIQLLNTTVEVSSGSWFKTVRIDDRGAPRELERTLKRLGAKL